MPGKVIYKRDKKAVGRGDCVIDAYINGTWVFTYDAYVSKGGYVYTLYPKRKGMPFGQNMCKVIKLSVYDICL